MSGPGLKSKWNRNGPQLGPLWRLSAVIGGFPSNEVRNTKFAHLFEKVAEFAGRKPTAACLSRFTGRYLVTGSIRSPILFLY